MQGKVVSNTKHVQQCSSYNIAETNPHNTIWNAWQKYPLSDNDTTLMTHFTGANPQMIHYTYGAQDDTV
jgi:hypothetical protein